MWALKFSPIRGHEATVRVLGYTSLLWEQVEATKYQPLALAKTCVKFKP
jgi:hypothetical protein